MRQLLDVTDRRTRLLQQVLMAACGALAGFGFVMFRTGFLPVVVAVTIIASALALLAFTAGIKQRWEIEYRGHRIRFENSPVTAERLFLDEGLVARGGFGMKMELRAQIRVGDAAGEEIMALVDAGFREFRLRIFVGNETVDTGPNPPLGQVPTTAIRGNTYETAAQDLRPVAESAVIGTVTLAKSILELIASMIAVVGGAGAALAWLLQRGP